ncbi:hypothetical protein ACPXCE_03995 [Streptomyces sp. DT24]|uniref:hypothetical protein n=1 Tax=unclassified Streptomyces TaxID=2593676 RepID=UPI0023B8F654|nr:hypothetical protein [Streptomyces sp. AM 4-1-1]WEH37166.1 hypothetical protein PZB75_29650 [Streptomyces sp. AM 4-1-1]
MSGRNEKHGEDTGHGSSPAEESALDEVLKEFEDAETDVPSSARRRSERDGESGDALSPNEAAQESAERDR